MKILPVIVTAFISTTGAAHAVDGASPELVADLNAKMQCAELANLAQLQDGGKASEKAFQKWLEFQKAALPFEYNPAPSEMAQDYASYYHWAAGDIDEEAEKILNGQYNPEGWKAAGKTLYASHNCSYVVSK